MKVTNTGNSSVEKTVGTDRASQIADSKGKRKTNSASSSSDIASSDKVSISSRAKEASMAREVAKYSPEVDEEKVARLKAAIQNGQYKVDADAIADRLVDEHIATAY